jgi:hypothetical protein
MNSPIKEPTLASTWQAVAGSPLADQFLEWPADLFAVTNVILERWVKRAADSLPARVTEPDAECRFAKNFLQSPGRFASRLLASTYVARLSLYPLWP